MAEFSPAAQTRDRLRPECRACHNAAEKARNKTHRASSTKAYKRDERFRRQYGITLAEYEEMYEAQGGVCAICRRPDAWKRRDEQPLCVDHDHATGTVRGLLCHYCNGMLGWGRDDPQVLAEAAEYLRRAEARSPGRIPR